MSIRRASTHALASFEVGVEVMHEEREYSPQVKLVS